MPSEEQVHRFRSEVEALAGGPPERLGVAVSGGPDSLALLLLAHAAWPGGVRAATVDHRLRAASAGEAGFVGGVCRSLGVPHGVLADEQATFGAGNLQAQARALRYRLLSGWAAREGIRFVATAHHADDQAETVLMRLSRGAGLAGLAAVRPRRTLGEAILLRPLLSWRRHELAAIVEGAGIAAVDDPSNRSEAHDRTRFRRLLAETDLLPPARLAAAAGHLREAEEALAWAAEREWRDRARIEEGAIEVDVEGLPPELRRRLAARAIGELRDGGEWREDKLAASLEAVAAGGRVTLAGVQIGGGERWRFEPEPPRRNR
jgi:tRNA(Ile)-lysidine synthase